MADNKKFRASLKLLTPTGTEIYFERLLLLFATLLKNFLYFIFPFSFIIVAQNDRQEHVRIAKKKYESN